MEKPTGKWLEEKPRGFLKKLTFLAGAYVSARSLYHILQVRRTLRLLPARARPIAWVLFGLGIALILTIPLIALHHGHLEAVTFQDHNLNTRHMPVFSLTLALAGEAFGWAAVLAGASLTNIYLFTAAALLYLFTFTSIGFVGQTQSYWWAVPSWLLPGLLAAAPFASQNRGLRLTLIWAFCLLAVYHSVRLTPLHDDLLHSPLRDVAGGWGQSVFVLIPASGLVALGLSRLPLRLSIVSGFVVASAVNIAFLVGHAGRAVALAGNVDYSLAVLVNLLAVFWFLLAAGLVEFGLDVTGVTLKALAWFFSERALPVVVVAVWIGELLLIHRLEHGVSSEQWLSFHPLVVIALCGCAAVLTARRMFTARWALALFAVWAFSLALLSGYDQEAERVGRAAALFVFGGALWELLKGMHRLPKEDRRWASAQGLLLVYLGSLVFLVAGTHFRFASGADDAMEIAGLSQLRGIAALWLPLVLYALLYEQRWVRPPQRGMVLRAFLAGVVISTIAYLLRMIFQEPGQAGIAANLAILAAAAATQLLYVGVILFRSPEVPRPLDAAVTGMACAMGFAVAYGQGMMLRFTIIGLSTIAVLGIPPGLDGGLAQRYAQTDKALPAADSLYLHGAGLTGTAVAGLLLARGRRRGRPGQGVWQAAVALAASLAYAAPTYHRALYLHPIMLYERLFSDPRVLYEVVAYLAVPLALLAAVIYWAAWKPEIVAASERAFAPEGAIPVPTE